MNKPNSVRLDDTLTADLDALAAATERTKAWHIERAVRAYVADEMAFIAAVRKGRADIDAGQGVPWEQVKVELDGIVDGHGAN